MINRSIIQLIYLLLLLLYFYCRHCEEAFSADVAIYLATRNDICFYSISLKDCFTDKSVQAGSTLIRPLNDDLYSSRSSVQTAFFFTLVFPPPSSSPKIFACLYCSGTWGTSYTRETLIVQGIVNNVVFFNVCFHIF